MDGAMAGIRVDLQGMTQKPEILGQISLGGVLGVREKISNALDIARNLLGSTDSHAQAARIADLLRRLEENASGYLSDYQANEITRLIDEADGMAGNAVPDEEAKKFSEPLLEAIEEAEIELVRLEAVDIPVKERESDGVWESVALLAALGTLAWALS